MIYTVLRFLLFAASLSVVLGVWALFSDTINLLAVLVLALVVSGVGSYFLLDPPRQRLADRVETRARAATDRFEEMRSKEDAD